MKLRVDHLGGVGGRLGIECDQNRFLKHEENRGEISGLKQINKEITTRHQDVT